MNITIKESMILRKCINNYVLENNLEYDKSPLFNDLIHKLKDVEKDNINSKYLNDTRKSLNKELKRYSFQTISNGKILEIDKENKRIK